MPVGRADILRLAVLRRVIQEHLAMEGRTVELILDPPKEYASDVYEAYGKRQNPAPIWGMRGGESADPRLFIDPPIWSYEAPEFISLRRAMKWHTTEANGLLDFVDEVRVTCPKKKHTIPKEEWPRSTHGRVWSSGSLALKSMKGGPYPGADSEVMGGGTGPPPTSVQDLIALRGIAQRGDLRCPEHPEAVLEDYPVVHGYARSFAFFSSTSKMSTLSWSLPAGPSQMGGTCPAARGMAGLAGTPLDDPDKRRNVAAFQGTIKLMEKVSGANLAAEQFITNPLVLEEGRPVELPGEHSVQQLLDAGTSFTFDTADLISTNICDACYALKANYANVTTQLSATLRLFWLEYALGKVWDPQQGAGGFKGSPTKENMDRTVGTLVEAMQLAFANRKTRAFAQHSLRHFRVHDSADFAAPYMVDLWGRVCEAMPQILFWFPTRVWFLPKFQKKIQAWVERLPNMTIRPSALRFGEQAPEALTQEVLSTYPIAGSGAGVTGKEAQWPCPAYLSRDATCANAVNPLGAQYLIDTYGVDPLTIMQQAAWTDDEVEAYENGQMYSSWLTERPTVTKRKRVEGVMEDVVVTRKPAGLKEGLKRKPFARILKERRGAVPEYEIILQKEFLDSDGVPKGLGCRVCWGGLNPGPGNADNADFAGVTVTYHEH